MTAQTTQKWNMVKLADLANVTTGKTPPTKDPQYWGGNYPFLTPSDISNGVRYVEKVERSVSSNWQKKAPKYLIRANSTCFVCIGSTVGKIAMMQCDGFTNQQLNCLSGTANLIDDFFLFYLLKNEKDKIKSIADARGAGKAIINKTDFENLEFKIPPLATQKQIADVLSVYDDLIENNNRRIKILEETAQKIYTEWFVNFRFPGHGKVKMVDSGTEFGMIPEGWATKSLGSEIELAYGKALKEENRIPGDVLVCGSGGVVGTHNQKLVSGPGVVVGRKGNAGAVFWVHKDFFPIDTAFFVQTKLPIEFVLYLLKFQNFILGDAAVPGLNREQAYRNPMLLPTSNLINDFADRVKPLRELADKLRDENLNLKKSRDLLIPQLVGGKLEIK